MSFHECDITDDRCCAVQNIGHRAESRGRIAFREADHRAGIADFARAGPVVSESREGGAGFAGRARRGLGWPASSRSLWLASACVPSQPRLQAFGRGELPERRMLGRPRPACSMPLTHVHEQP